VIRVRIQTGLSSVEGFVDVAEPYSLPTLLEQESFFVYPSREAARPSHVVRVKSVVFMTHIEDESQG
jgi:hypothetical protein